MNDSSPLGAAGTSNISFFSSLSEAPCALYGKWGPPNPHPSSVCNGSTLLFAFQEPSRSVLSSAHFLVRMRQVLSPTMGHPLFSFATSILLFLLCVCTYYNTLYTPLYIDSISSLIYLPSQQFTSSTSSYALIDVHILLYIFTFYECIYWHCKGFFF